MNWLFYVATYLWNLVVKNIWIKTPSVQAIFIYYIDNKRKLGFDYLVRNIMYANKFSTINHTIIL